MTQKVATATLRSPAALGESTHGIPKRYSLNCFLGVAIGSIALVAVLSSGLVLVTLNQLRSATEVRGRANQILIELGAFQAAMLDQETGLRGYLLTGARINLESYRTGVVALSRSTERLRELVGDDAVERSQLAAAETAASTWGAVNADPALADMRDPSRHGAAFRLGSGLESNGRFDAFRAQLAAIQHNEQDRLAAASAAVTRAQREAQAALWIGAIVTLLICGAIAWIINGLVARPLLKLADVMRRLAQRDLTADVPSLDQKNEVGEMARAVEVFKAGLIARVQLLAELQAARGEAEDKSRVLDTLNKQNTLLLSIIAHDLRNPFQVILGLSDVLSRAVETRDVASIERRAQGIHQATNQAHALMESLFAWATLQMNTITVTMRSVDVEAVARETLAGAAEAAADKGLSLRADCSGLHVNANRDMLATILRNLVSNAVKFTPIGGAVTISTRSEGDGVEISVADTGVGIAPNKVDDLFKLDRRVTTNGTEGERGNGLGLLLCRDLVECLGSELHVKSSVGYGTIFRFTLATRGSGQADPVLAMKNVAS